MGLKEDVAALKYDSERRLARAAEICHNLGGLLEDMYLAPEDDRDLLNMGLHMMSLYEQLMILIESDMHPSYRKNIESFRAEKLRIPDESNT